MAHTIQANFEDLASGDSRPVIAFGTLVVEACTRALRGETTYVELDGGVVAAIVPPETAG